MNLYTLEPLKKLPMCTKRCGIVLGRPERDQFSAQLLPEDTPPPRPPHHGDSDEVDIVKTTDGTRFKIVGGDGACPGQANDLRFR
eukprot:5667934-Pyramimonas_sp.AAC.1